MVLVTICCRLYYGQVLLTVFLTDYCMLSVLQPGAVLHVLHSCARS
jgi:hypothetical protein